MLEQLSLAEVDATFGADVTDLPERLAKKVEVQADGCWRWAGTDTDHGYGRVSYEGKQHRAHRLVWWLLTGQPLPEVLHHRCCNPLCVNPAHLEATTAAEHPDSAPAVQRAKTACHRGHPFTPENTIRKKGGGRYCRTCRREHNRAYQRRKAAA